MNCINDTEHLIALLPSVSHVMKAEKLLISEKIPIKIIPVPKSISSDCGVCIRFNNNMFAIIKSVLDKNFESVEYRKL